MATSAYLPICSLTQFIFVCFCVEIKEPDLAETRENLVMDNVPIQPRRVSGQYFFEYLVVVSLKKKKDGSNYEPQITYQFPKVSHTVKSKFTQAVGSLTHSCFK